MSIPTRDQIGVQFKKISPFLFRLASFLIGWSWLFILVINGSSFTPLIQAQVSGSSQVSATIQDGTPPAPILVSPANNSLVSTGLVNFVWKTTTSPVEIAEFQLTVDGQLKFANILTPGDYPGYTLTYNPLTLEYTLIIKQALNDGAHNWKVTAVSTLNKSNSSATWAFTVDATAPSFVINHLGDEEVSISAQDASTVPDEPIVLYDNEPLILATGESLSQVEITLAIDGEIDLTDFQAIDADGNWSYQLGILPRDEIITLNFIITDKALHISAIQNLQFIIRRRSTSPSATPTPTAAPASQASPTPSTPTVTPESPGGVISPVPPTPTTWPTPTPPSPSPTSWWPEIEIPPAAPKEAVYLIVKNLAPELVRQATQVPWLKKLLASLGQFGSLLILSWPAMIATLWLMADFKFNLTPKILLRIWQAIGLLPTTNFQGYVFDQANHQPVAFARVTFIRPPRPDQLPHTDTVLTDLTGRYPQPDLPAGDYQASVSQRDYLFPTHQPRPALLNYQSYYLGENFFINDQTPDSGLFIPLDMSLDHSVPSLNQQIKIWSSRLTGWQHPAQTILMMIALTIWLFYPSFWNYLGIGLSLLNLVWKKAYWPLTKQLTGLIVDDGGQPIPNTITQLSYQPNQPLTDQQLPKLLTRTALTNRHGQFHFHQAKNIRQLLAYHPDWQLSAQSDKELMTTNWLNHPTKLILMMVRKT